MPNSGTIRPQVSIILEALTVDSYYLKYIYFAVKPRQKDRSRLVTNRLRPGLVKTGLVTAKRPRPTTADRSLAVRSSLLWFLDLRGPVSVSVQASRGKRPDRTGLSNTTYTHHRGITKTFHRISSYQLIMGN